MLLRLRSLTGLGWHGPFARHQAATGDEATETCANGRSTFLDAFSGFVRIDEIDIGTQLLRSSFALHAGPNRWCTSRRGVNGEVRDVSAIVWAYYRTDRCIQTSPHRRLWWCISPVACAQQAVHRYCLNLRPSGAECPHTRNPVGHVQPRIACAGPQPTGIRAI